MKKKIIINYEDENNKDRSQKLIKNKFKLNFNQAYISLNKNIKKSCDSHYCRCFRFSPKCLLLSSGLD